MSKKLKNFIIIIACVVAVVGLGVGGYFVMASISNTVVYDFKIINPTTGKHMNTTQMYLVSGKNNSFPIQVVCQTNGGKNSYTFSSSNPEVAQVVQDDDGYRVEYYTVGQAVITARSRAVKKITDSFTLNVSQELVADIDMTNSVQTNGELSGDKIVDNKTVQLYADGTTQQYVFKSTGALEAIDCNNMSLRIVNNFDGNVFQDISIDQDEQIITITPKIKNIDSVQNFYIQAYYTDEHDQEHIVKNYKFFVDVIGYRIADLQLLVSQDYNFVGTTYVLLADGSNNQQALLQNPDNEQIIDGINFTDDVLDIYFKVRAVYTNKTFADVSLQDTQSMAAAGTPSDNGVSCIGIDRDESGFWRILVDSDIIKKTQQSSETTSLGFSMSHTDYVKDTDGKELTDPVSRTFYISYLNRSDNAASKYQDFINNKLYAKDGQFYVYIYWDTRFQRRDVSVDKDGNIIGFYDDPPTCDSVQSI